MKKLFIVMLAFAGIRQANAQTEVNSNSNSVLNQVFSPDPSVLRHQFTVELTKRNKMIVEVPELKTLTLLGNVDFILLQALKDLQPLKDSLETETNSKTVDYVIDLQQNKKVRIKDHQAGENTFAIKGADISLLKTNQDTLNIIGILPGFKYSYTKDEINVFHRQQSQLYWRIRVVVNNIGDIHTYLNGVLNQSMKNITHDYVTSDVLKEKKERDVVHRSATYFPYDNTKKPEQSYRTSAFIELPYLRAGIQTFGNTVAPTLSIGLSMGFRRENITHYFTYSWEPVFFFERGAKGQLSQFRNDFFTIQYMRLNRNSENNLDLFNACSLSYLKNKHRRGEYFEENTFKLGVPGLKYKGITIQPQFVFNDFFKNVSPGFKINIGF